MVRPLPVLRSGSRSDLAKQSSQLFTLQRTATAGCATWIARPPELFLWSSDVDKDTRLAILRILEVLHEAMKRASETHILTLQIHDALVKARVPDYLEAYDSRDDNPLSELTDVKNKLTHLVDTGIQALRENCAR
jgi:hypothetical protein